MEYSEIKQILQSIADPVEKLEMVMDFGKSLSPVPAGAKCTEILGCSSYVEICRHGDKFYGRADSKLVAGIVALIMAMIDGKTIAEIKSMDIAQEISELNINLGIARLGGINSMASFFKNL